MDGIESAKKLINKKFGIAFLPYISVKEELYKKQWKIIKAPEFDMNLDVTMLYKRNRPGYVGRLCGLVYCRMAADSFC